MANYNQARDDDGKYTDQGNDNSWWKWVLPLALSLLALWLAFSALNKAQDVQEQVDTVKSQQQATQTQIQRLQSDLNKR